ncbi:MAG TPA: hypothetical protein VM784_05990 [Actinomycetota bacterium]|nr:hypothetical protein [Actinomycetota bacterium]
MPDPATPPPANEPPPGLRLSEILTIQDESDDTNRLLLEDSAPKKARRKAVDLGVAMKTERCPYDDTPSRHGRLMNVSAYQALRHDLTAVLDGFAWLTSRYLALDPAARGNLRCLVVVGKLGVTVPLLLFHRAEHPVPSYGSLPSYIASLFKASRGLFSLSVAMMNSVGAVKTTGAQVVRFADEHRHLIRPETQRVCAAPSKLIARTVDVVLTGEGGDAARSSLPELLEFDALWEFFRLEAALSDGCDRYRLFLEELGRRMSVGGTDFGRVFATAAQHPALRGPLNEATDGLVQHASAIQARLNRVLGRADSRSSLDVDDVLQML